MTKSKVKKKVVQKNPEGAPPIYNIEVVKKELKKYMDICLENDKPPSIGDFSTVYKYRNKLEDVIPSRTRMYEFELEDAKLSNMLRELRSMREEMLKNKGYTNEYNANLVKFELSAHKDYRDEYTPNSEKIIVQENPFENLPLEAKKKIKDIMDKFKK